MRKNNDPRLRTQKSLRPELVRMKIGGGAMYLLELSNCQTKEHLREREKGRDHTYLSRWIHHRSSYEVEVRFGGGRSNSSREKW
jgi:hypothetical protein